MKSKILCMSFLLQAIVCTAFAQALQVTGTLKGNVPADLRLYIMPAERIWDKPDSISVVNGSIQTETSLSSIQVYKVVGVTQQRQIILPLSLKETAGKASLNLTFAADGNLTVDKANAETSALMAFNDLYVGRAKQMWMAGKTMSDTDLRNLIMGYTASADSLVNVYHPSSSIDQYLHLWAATLTFEGIENVKFATGREVAGLGIDPKAENEKLLKCVDCDMSSAFESAPRLALSVIPQGGLADKITAIESQVKNKGLKVRVEDLLLNKYISTFNYADNYAEGLQELTSLTERFQLDTKYLGEFKVRKSSIAGTPFPADVVLTDLQGKKVDFAKYCGKYVFIDLWASWCIPCIKEIPHLKQLEKDLQNKDVVFLSISIDTNVAAWKKKVAALGLKGELLNNQDNKLCESLNVSGIPFFLIYDKEGKLYKYNAYRPSDMRLKPLLEGLK